MLNISVFHCSMLDQRQDHRLVHIVDQHGYKVPEDLIQAMMPPIKRPKNQIRPSIRTMEPIKLTALAMNHSSGVKMHRTN